MVGHLGVTAAELVGGYGFLRILLGAVHASVALGVLVLAASSEFLFVGIVAAGGSDAREAHLVAENLATANLVGHDSHGIGMIPRYVAALLEGGLKPNRHPQATLDTPSLMVLDGQAGYGQAAYPPPPPGARDAAPAGDKVNELPAQILPLLTVIVKAF